MENLSPTPNKIVPPKYQRNETKLHRFVPTEKPRVVVEHSTQAPMKIAGGVGFDPVATLDLPDKTVFVRPVKNTQARPISPSAVNTSGKLKVTGDRSIEISDKLHSQIKAKATSTMEALVPPKPTTVPATPEHYATPANLQNLTKPIPAAGPTENQVQTQARNETLKNQLGHINKTLFEQIKSKISEEISKQSSVQKPVQVQTTRLAETKQIAPAVKPLAEEKPVQKPAEEKYTRTGPLSQPTRDHLRALIETKPTELKTNNEAATLPLPSFNIAESKPQEVPTITPSINVPVQKEVFAPSPTTKFVAPEQTKEQTKTPPSLGDYKQHISQLEEELNLLNKEVNYMDRTMAGLEKERDLQELSSLEKKIDVDRQMLSAVADWRAALNNLINSHTVALKYLKQKTDWLESQVDRLSGHRDKHAGSHHKPKPIEIKMSPLPPVEIPKPAEVKITNIEAGKQLPAINPEVVIGSTLNVAALNQSQVAESQATAKPKEDQIALQANLITKEVRPEEVGKVTGPTVVKEVQTTSFEAVKDMVQESLRKEQPNIKPSQESVKELVEQILEEKNAVAKPTTESVKEVLSQTLKSEPSLVKPSVEEIKTIVKEEIAQAPPAEVQVSQADIEKQILDQAAKEEAEKEKREELRKKAEEEALKKLSEVKTSQESPTNVSPPTITQPDVSDDALKGAFAKLKTDLTTIDPQALDGLSTYKRTEMIQKLQNLEKETEVSKQYDELKAAAERRRINNELQNMFAAVGAKPVSAATIQEPPVLPTQQKIETLKIEQKKQQTPEEKARVIAEIKDLDRQAQARKAAEASRPVVKAQPAYGKMLPNTPTVPNVINGLVKDAKGLLLPTVVIIVKDRNDDPVRALKTNKIGQFALSTAVPNGTYTLELEKDGYDFDIIEIDVNGTIMQPIEIKSK